MQLRMTIQEHRLPFVIGGLFCLYALMHVGYGLPLHLVGDEESLIAGALKIVQLRSLPVFHLGEFGLLYYSILLPILYDVFFVAYAASIYLFVPGMHTLVSQQQYLLAHLDVLWLFARIPSVFGGGALIVATGMLARRLVPDRAGVGVFATLFMVTSFFTFQLSVVARHWILSTLFLVLALLSVYRHDQVEKRDGIWAAVFAGLGVGIGPLGFVTVALIYFALFMKSGVTIRAFIRSRVALVYLGVAMLLATLFVAAHPGAFLFIAAGESTVPLAAKGPGYFINQASISFWYLMQHEFALTISAIIGFIILATTTYRRLALLFAGLVIGYVLFLYMFLHNEPRYHLYIVPCFAIIAAVGVSHLLALQRRQAARWVVWMVFVALLLVAAGGVVRYGQLLQRASTEQLAYQWVMTHIDEGPFIVNAPFINFVQEDQFVSIDAEEGRALQMSLLLRGVDVAQYGLRKVPYLNLHFWDSQDTQELSRVIAETNARYAIISYTNSSELDSAVNRYLIEHASLVAEFTNGRGNEGYALQPFDEYGLLNIRLFQITQFGSYVRILKFG